MFLGRESRKLEGGRAAPVLRRVHLFGRESSQNTTSDARGAAQTPRVVRAVQSKRTFGLDVLQTPGADKAFFSTSCGTGLRCMRRGTATAVRLLFAAEAFVRDARAAGAAASLTLGKGPGHEGGGIR